jgi:hypothetical protein
LRDCDDEVAEVMLADQHGIEASGFGKVDVVENLAVALGLRVSDPGHRVSAVVSECE